MSRTKPGLDISGEKAGWVRKTEPSEGSKHS